jgi:hypothetical protein
MMKTLTRTILAAAALSLLAGCSTFNSLTGQNDNTVLPGKREDAIPGRAQFPDKPDVAVGSTSAAGASGAGAEETYCAPDDAACKPPKTTGDTFKDPQ